MLEQISIMKLISIFSIATILILIDQISKWFFTKKYYLQEYFISITYSQNTGSSFSLFQNIPYYSMFIIILSIIVIILILRSHNFFLKSTYLNWTFAFILAGIVGNLIDRIIFSYVRDFISIKYLFIFNPADLYLTLAIISYLLYEYSENKALKMQNSKNG